MATSPAFPGRERLRSANHRPFHKNKLTSFVKSNLQSKKGVVLCGGRTQRDEAAPAAD
jgi:hypothetical protein